MIAMRQVSSWHALSLWPLAGTSLIPSHSVAARMLARIVSFSPYPSRASVHVRKLRSSPIKDLSLWKAISRWNGVRGFVFTMTYFIPSTS